MGGDIRKRLKACCELVTDLGISELKCLFLEQVPERQIGHCVNGLSVTHRNQMREQTQDSKRRYCLETMTSYSVSERIVTGRTTNVHLKKPDIHLSYLNQEFSMFLQMNTPCHGQQTGFSHFIGPLCNNSGSRTKHKTDVEYS